MILPRLRTAMLAAFPGLDAPTKAFFRIARAVAGRVNLQPLFAKLDQTADLSNVEICPGVPGVTSDATEGEQVIVALVGKDRAPFVIARASDRMPGHTPSEVRHDATAAIRLVSKPASIAAKVYVGSATFPLAKALEVQALLVALQGAASTMLASPDPSTIIVGGILQSALAGVLITGTTKLEAQ